MEYAMGRTSSTNDRKQNAYSVLAGRAKGKRSLAIPRHRQEDGRVRTGFIWLL
jgi:hypothetical protein